MRAAFILALLLGISACASQAAREIDVASFRNFGDTPTLHTVYVGSDAEFHYFRWASLPRSGEWKVRKSAMPFRVEWPVGADRRAFMTTDESGAWQPKLRPP